MIKLPPHHMHCNINLWNNTVRKKQATIYKRYVVMNYNNVIFRCSDIFNDHNTTSLLLSLLVKSFWNQAFIQCKDCENWSIRSGDIRPNTPVFGRVVPDVHKWALSTLELLDQISRNFHTIYKASFNLCC